MEKGLFAWSLLLGPTIDSATLWWHRIYIVVYQVRIRNSKLKDKLVVEEKKGEERSQALLLPNGLRSIYFLLIHKNFLAGVFSRFLKNEHCYCFVNLQEVIAEAKEMFV